MCGVVSLNCGAEPFPLDAPEPAAAPAAPSGSHSPEAKRLIDALTTLFTSKDTKLQNAVIEENYAPNATFIDNLVHVSGHASMKVQFHAIAKMLRFATFEATQSNIEDKEDGRRTVKIENKQSYGVGSSTVKLNVLTTLMLDKVGKIEKHTDEWHGRWGQFGICKRILGSSSSALMRLLRV